MRPRGVEVGAGLDQGVNLGAIAVCGGGHEFGIAVGVTSFYLDDLVLGVLCVVVGALNSGDGQ
jgi:hypothetical protein